MWPSSSHCSPIKCFNSFTHFYCHYLTKVQILANKNRKTKKKYFANLIKFHRWRNAWNTANMYIVFFIVANSIILNGGTINQPPLVNRIFKYLNFYEQFRWICQLQHTLRNFFYCYLPCHIELDGKFIIFPLSSSVFVHLHFFAFNIISEFVAIFFSPGTLVLQSLDYKTERKNKSFSKTFLKH